MRRDRGSAGPEARELAERQPDERVAVVVAALAEKLAGRRSALRVEVARSIVHFLTDAAAARVQDQGVPGSGGDAATGARYRLWYSGLLYFRAMAVRLLVAVAAVLVLGG